MFKLILMESVMILLFVVHLILYKKTKSKWYLFIVIFITVVTAWAHLPLYDTFFIHNYYKVMRSLGLRSKAQVLYYKNGNITVDKLDPGEVAYINVGVLIGGDE